MRGSLPMSVTSKSAWNSSWAMMRQLRVCGSELKTGDVIVGHLIRRMVWMKPLTGTQEWPQAHKPWSSWGIFSHSGICWRDQQQGTKPFQRFLEYANDNLLRKWLRNQQGKVWNPPTGRSWWNTMLQGIFGCSDHGRGALEILRAGRRTCSKLTSSSALTLGE